MGHVIDRKCLKERGFFFHFCNNFGFGKNIKRVNIIIQYVAQYPASTCNQPLETAPFLLFSKQSISNGS